MSKVNTGGTPSNTIPLDSLDMTYLGQYIMSTPRAERMLLWSKKQLDGESETCHVQIVTRDNNDEDSHSEPCDSYRCHICNVNVPTMYYEKHNESDQHETIKKIYQKVLEGVSKEININTILDKREVRKDVYYCAPCSKIIKIENKQKHEDGDYHAKSLQDLIITMEFYKILKEKESYDESEVNKTVLCEVNEAALGEVGDLEPDRLSLKGNDSYDINNLNLEVSSSTLDSDDDCLADLQTPVLRGIFKTMNNIINEQKKKSFEEYLNEVIKIYNLNVNLPVVNGEFISIVSPNGDSVQVSREHFHSYSVNENVIICQLCKMGMWKNTSLHDISENHVRNIFRPINDKFARCVDTIWSHCVPCNKMVLTKYNHHTFNDDHKKIIKDTQTPKTGKTFCKEFLPKIDYQDNAPMMINDSMLCSENQNDIKPTENKVEIATKPSSANTHATDIGASTSGINDIEAITSSGSSTVTANSNVSDHEDEKIEQNTSPGSSTVTTYGKTLCTGCKVYVDTNKFSVHLSSDEHLSGLLQKHFAKKTNDSIVLSNRSNNSTVISNPSNASTEINNQKNEPTEINNHNNAPTEINNQNNAPIDINNRNNASDSTNHESSVVDIKVNDSILYSENQNDIKPTENKVEIATNQSSANTRATDTDASTSGINNIEANTSTGSSTVTANSIFSDHEDEKNEQNTSPGSVTVKRDEPSDTNKYDICNINVPTMCYEKHNESDQQETVKNIYQKILEGASKQININTKLIKQDIGKYVYYENKQKHEDGDYHAKSVKELIITNEFDKIYKEKESYDESEVNYYLADIQTPVQREMLETVNDEVLNEQEMKSAEKRVKKMFKKYNLNLPILDGEFVSIVAPNGDTVQVSLKHFHSYIEVGYNIVYCQLCKKKWMSKYTVLHNISEDHLRSIFRPIDDNFTRWVDTISSHCIPCNEIILTESDHTTLSDVHKKIIKDTLTHKTGKTFCNSNNASTEINNQNNAPTEINNQNNAPIEINNDSPAVDINAVVNDSRYCGLCKVNVQSGGMKSHVDGKRHKKVVSKLCSENQNDIKPTENKIEIVTEPSSTNTGASKLCSENQNNIKPTENKIEIVTEPSSTNTGASKLCSENQNNIKPTENKIEIVTEPSSTNTGASKLCSENQNDIKPTENKIEIGTEPSSTNTGTTDTGASTSGINNIEANTSAESSTENWNFVPDLEAQKIIGYYNQVEFVDETRTKVRCKICSVFFIVKDIVEHMEGRNHKKNFHKHNDKQNSPKQKMEAYNKLLFYTNDEKTQIKCEICDVDIPYMEKNIIEHMEGRNHLEAENELLKFHLIRRESFEFICECCIIRITDYLDHINSKTHTLEFLEITVIDKDEMRKYVYEDNLCNAVSRRHRELYRNLLNHNGIYKIDDTSYYCGMCQVTLCRISEIDHVLGEKHVSEVKKLSLLQKLIHLTEKHHE